MIKMALKLQFFVAKSQKPQSSSRLCPTGPLCDTTELHQFVQHGDKIRQSLCKKKTKKLLVQENQNLPS